MPGGKRLPPVPLVRIGDLIWKAHGAELNYGRAVMGFW